MDERAYAEVIVDLPVANTDKIFHYHVPPHLRASLQQGVRVQVPFGSKRLTGFVVGFSHKPAVSPTKDILAVVDGQPAFTPELYALARWLSQRCLCTMARALRAIAAPSRSGSARFADQVYPADSPVEGEGRLLERAPKQAVAWRVAREFPGLTRSQLAARAGVSLHVVNALIGKGVLTLARRAVTRRPYPATGRAGIASKAGLPVLTKEQLTALEAITNGLESGERQVFLVHGVTGSGKTEVYIRSVVSVLSRGRQALVLVPEIALTGQMVKQFRERFGDQVAVLHSRLGSGERYDEWRRIYDGKAPVVLGARSAVFAPLPDLGLIIVDEEHEPSYKQEEDPKYHTRDVAFARATMQNAVVVLGTATPSLKTFARTIKGGAGLLKLDHRVENRPMPRVTLVDLRDEYRTGNRRVFSRYLVGRISEKLAQKEQVILFLNRRGYSSVVLCRECGLVMRCPHCAISLTHHRDGLLRCHYCNHQSWLPAQCPSCRSSYLTTLGTGTQKVEEEVERLFPGARVVRMDSDTVTRKNAHERILHTFTSGQADIMIGTQMVAKGLDIPGVTLVGVISADTSLLLPDFRAAERTFQLITQVAGRAGRGDLKGEVVVQTYCPEHYSILAAVEHNYEQFFIREMNMRRKLQYPPFSSLARVVVRGLDENEVRESSRVFKRNLMPSSGDRVQIMGPAPAPVSRIKDQYRWHLVLKAPQARILRNLLRDALERFERLSRQRVTVSIDIDPEYIN